MSILVCGSVAYDTIMVFQDYFKRHILPDQIHILNVSFFAPEMRREFGGCAGNIAYSLKLLGADPLIMATVGEDSGPYRERLTALGIDSRHLLGIPGAYTAQCFITTDLDDNQITAFHPGAMMQSHCNRISDVQGAGLAIVAPDGREGMMSHVDGLAAAEIPFVFDPGQAMPILSADDLHKAVNLARWCTVNDYEARLLCERCGLTLEQLAERLDALVVTYGAEGSRIYTRGTTIDVPAAQANAVVDPTGCGDAYRAGLLYGLENDWDIVRSARLASVLGAVKIAHRGGQNHRPDRAEIAQRYAETYGERPW